MNSWVTTICLLLAVTGVVVDAFPTGPPVQLENVCRDMVPYGHGQSNATGAAPYTLSVDDEEVNDRTIYTVTLSGNPSTEIFEGFFIQARSWDTESAREVDSTPIGLFSAISPRTKELDCDVEAGTGNAWGHNDSSAKQTVQATWTSPSGSGDVIFRATVVQGPASVYWLELYSSVQSYDSSAGGIRLSVIAIVGGVLVSLLVQRQM